MVDSILTYTRTEFYDDDLLLIAIGSRCLRLPEVTLLATIKFLDMILNTIPLSKDDQDSMTTTNNLDPYFVVDIPTNGD